ncbi:transcriptional regulator [Herbaspirillum sp. CF444]|uniref:LysR family transcriptional regulator n=1 Tax=Herbaspirillum sp. CF444 TaxID=1144319 RepID=UPI00027251EB|nr:LysR family transcriptional regulator [Herbaspirillum sp. CF444]EJL86748.1 transcriptional regulator [Herbaspirillum sp. CF444]
MNKLREIECFIAVAELGSFVKAADALNVSKAAVSRTILELEARLGARLMQRTTRRLSLTEAGSLYLERCKQIVSALEDADQMLTVGNTDPTGLLRINVPQTFGVLHLVKVWPCLLRRYPGIRLDITLSDRIVDIIEEGYDLAIRIARLPNSSLIYRKLASTRILVCASPEYLEKHGTPRHPDDLKDHMVMGYSYSADKDEWHFEGPEGAVSVKTNVRMLANNGDTCVAAALAGIGITRQPTFMLSEHIRSGKLVPIMPDYMSAELGIYAVYPSRTHLPAKVRATIDFLVHAFEEVQWEDK